MMVIFMISVIKSVHIIETSNCSVIGSRIKISSVSIVSQSIYRSLLNEVNRNIFNCTVTSTLLTHNQSYIDILSSLNVYLETLQKRNEFITACIIGSSGLFQVVAPMTYLFNIPLIAYITDKVDYTLPPEVSVTKINNQISTDIESIITIIAMNPKYTPIMFFINNIYSFDFRLKFHQESQKKSLSVSIIKVNEVDGRIVIDNDILIRYLKNSIYFMFILQIESTNIDKLICYLKMSGFLTDNTILFYIGEPLRTMNCYHPIIGIEKVSDTTNITEIFRISMFLSHVFKQNYLEWITTNASKHYPYTWARGAKSLRSNYNFDKISIELDVNGNIAYKKGIVRFCSNARLDWINIGVINGYSSSNKVNIDNVLNGYLLKNGKVLKAVTIDEAPFMSLKAVTNWESCKNGKMCLRINTSMNQQIDEIFLDYFWNRNKLREHYSVLCCTGVFVEFTERLEIDLNKRIHLYATTENVYGSYSEGEWNGIIREISDGNANLSIALLTITPERKMVVDFLRPLFPSRYVFITRKVTVTPPITVIFEPYSKESWILIFCLLIIVTTVMGIIEWNSPYGYNSPERYHKGNYTLGSSFTMAVAVLTGRNFPIKIPKAWSTKFIQSCWAATCIIFVAQYTANLAGIFAYQSEKPDFTGIHDPELLKYRPGLIKNSSISALLKDLNPKLYNSIKPRNLFTMSTEGFAAIEKNEIDVYLTDETYIKAGQVFSDCSFRTNGYFGYNHHGIAVRKDDEEIKLIENFLIYYNEKGFYETLMNKYEVLSDCGKKKKIANLQLSSEDHVGTFVWLYGGVALCLVIFVVEIVMYHTLIQRIRKSQNKFWRSSVIKFISLRAYKIITAYKLSKKIMSLGRTKKPQEEIIKDN